LIDKYNKTKHTRNKIDKQTKNKIRKLIEIQRKIASRIVLKDDYSLKAVAGVDQAFLDEVVISGAVLPGCLFKGQELFQLPIKNRFSLYPRFSLLQGRACGNKGRQRP